MQRGCNLSGHAEQVCNPLGPELRVLLQVLDSLPAWQGQRTKYKGVARATQACLCEADDGVAGIDVEVVHDGRQRVFLDGMPALRTAPAQLRCTAHYLRHALPTMSAAQIPARGRTTRLGQRQTAWRLF